jgi:hypothetical protein
VEVLNIGKVLGILSDYSKYVEVLNICPNYHIWENPRSKWRWSSDYSWPMFQPYFHDDPMINLLPNIPVKYPYDLCNRDTIYYIVSQSIDQFSIDQFYISLLIFVDPTIRMLLKLPKSSKDLQQNIAKPRCFALRQAF